MTQARSRLSLVVTLIVALPLALAAFSWWALRPTDPVPLPTPSPTVSPDPTPSPTSSSSPAPAPSPSPTILPTQRTLLLQVRGPDSAPNSVVIGIGGDTGRAEFAYPPAGLLLDVPAAGPRTLSEAAVLPDTGAASAALSALIGVRIEGSFILDRLAFAGLVDAVNGVPVVVRSPMLINDDKGEFVMVIPEGARTLTGTEAAYYVMYLGPYEKESSRISRFADVLEKVIAALPEDPVRVGQILTSLGALARSTIPNEALVERLEWLRTQVRAGQQRSRDLPVDGIGPQPTRLFSLQLARSAALMRRMLSESVIPPGTADPIRLVVRTGAPNPDLATAARDELVEAGFTVIADGSASDRGRLPERTVIDVPPGVPQLRQQAGAVARTLGVSPLIVVRPFAAIADLRVTLGADALPD